MAWSLVHTNAITTASGATSVTATTISTVAGNCLIAVFGCSSGVAVTTPAGWIQAELESGDGETGIWYYPNNPGGITSVEFQWTGSTSAQLVVSEFSPNGAGVFSNLTAGAVATSADTLTVTTSADPSSGDLAVAGFFFGNLSSSATVSWTTPASWSLIAAESASLEWHLGAYFYNNPPTNADLSAEGQVATSQPKLSGAICTFSLVPAASGTAAVSLAAAATGSSRRSGSPSAAVTLAATATGSSRRAGSVTGAVTLAATASGSRKQSGAVTGALSLTATAAGSSKRSGSPQAALSLAASAAGSSRRAGSPAAAVALAAIAAGAKRALGAVTGAVSLAATATGIVKIPAAPATSSPTVARASTLTPTVTQANASVSTVTQAATSAPTVTQ